MRDSKTTTFGVESGDQQMTCRVTNGIYLAIAGIYKLFYTGRFPRCTTIRQGGAASKGFRIRSTRKVMLPLFGLRTTKARCHLTALCYLLSVPSSGRRRKDPSPD